ncbi:MAG: mannose-6-phosphate isomerase, class I [Oscillospiraceae bacterium]
MMFKLAPCFKDYLWGGTKLKEDFNFNSDFKKVAEAWMLSCHKDGENIVVGGKYDGKTLSEVINSEEKSILGKNAEKFDAFPILIKLIDAKDDLSVQVHPNDEYALKNEGEYGKTECWYIVDCEENAEIIYGFNEEITKDEFKQRIDDGTFLDVVNRVKVQKGELYFIEAGTLHAIGKGILLAEIQQNSNTTYRVFDYNRIDANGNTRELHTKKAIDVTNCVIPEAIESAKDRMNDKDGYFETLLAQCDLFTVYSLNIYKKCNKMVGDKSFVSILVLNGEGTIFCGCDKMLVKKGDSVFISADSGEFEIDGCLEVLETSL